MITKDIFDKFDDVKDLNADQICSVKNIIYSETFDKSEIATEQSFI